MPFFPGIFSGQSMPFLPGSICSILDSIVVSIPACHAGDQGSIPCRGAVLLTNKGPILIFLFFTLKSAPRQGIEPWSPA